MNLLLYNLRVMRQNYDSSDLFLSEISCRIFHGSPFIIHITGNLIFVIFQLLYKKYLLLYIPRLTQQVYFNLVLFNV